MTLFMSLSDPSSTQQLHAITFGDIFYSPYIIPVAGCVAGMGIVLGAIWSGVRNREIQSQERLAAIAAGLPVSPTVEELAMSRGGPTKIKPRDGRGARRAGIVLVSVAFGLIAFFIALAVILQTSQILAGAAVGLIPLLMGVGFLVDARINAREAAEAASSDTAFTDTR